MLGALVFSITQKIIAKSETWTIAAGINEACGNNCDEYACGHYQGQRSSSLLRSHSGLPLLSSYAMPQLVAVQPWLFAVEFRPKNPSYAVKIIILRNQVCK